MRTGNLISREDAVREALGLYRDAQQSVRKCREAEDDFGFLAFSGQKEAFRWMAMVLMALPAAGEDAPAKETNEPLTIEQLREMDGEPVWFDTIKRWGVVKVCRDGVFVLTKSGEFEVGRCKYYRRPPEGEEGDADRG